MARYDGYVNFSTGELSPLLRGRVDLDAYRHGLKTCLNLQPLHYGGLRMRNGTEYIMNAKDQSFGGKLIPFVISPEQAFVLELSGNGTTARVHPLNQFTAPLYTGTVPTDYTTPFTANDLAGVKWAQRGNFMVLCHPSYTPQALSRVSDFVWNWRPVPFRVLPSADLGIRLAVSANLSIASGTGSQTATATGATFLAGDVGRTIFRGNGFGYVTAVASSTSATVNVLQTFAGSSGDWFMGGNPRGTLSGILASSREGEQINLTSSADSFRAADVGSLLYANEGIYRIETMSATVATVTVIRVPTSGANSTAWFLRQPIFGGVSGNPTWGFPSTVTFHDQRMVLAGFPNKPQAFVGSVAGDVLDFTFSPNADDAYSWEVFSDQSDTIRHLVADNDLIVMTGSAEYAVSGQDFGTVTNADVRVRAQSTYGSSNVQPVKVGRDQVFVQRNARTVLAMRYEIQIQGYDSHDLTLLAEHITASQVTQLAYQRRPIPTLYAVLKSGKVACCTLDPIQKVTAWWLMDIAGGNVQSVCCVPNGDRDEVWLLVQRPGFTPTRYYLERIQTEYLPSAASITNTIANPKQRIGYLLDCCRRFDFAGAQYGQTIGPALGLTHLAGQPVAHVVDGAYGGTAQLDASGNATLAVVGTENYVGLSYAVDAEPMPMEMPTAGGTNLGRPGHSSEVNFVLHQTVGGVFNGQPGPSGTVTAADGPALSATAHNYRKNEITGHHKVAAEGWIIDGAQWRIQQNVPLPLHVLAVIPKSQVNP